ncbi:MAG: acyltransferase [Chitinophagaceae bacterium]
MSPRQPTSLSFRLLDFIFRKVLRQNARVPWAVHHTATIHHPQGLKVGVGTWPGDSPGVYINANNGVYIGDYTNLGPNVGIISSNHDFVNNDEILKASPIHIGRFCWLGMGAIVLPSVCLGDFTIVGAGAVVTKSFEAGYCVLAGNPATIIKRLSKDECDERARLHDAAQAGVA